MPRSRLRQGWLSPWREKPFHDRFLAVFLTGGLGGAAWETVASGALHSAGWPTNVAIQLAIAAGWAATYAWTEQGIWRWFSIRRRAPGGQDGPAQ